MLHVPRTPDAHLAQTRSLAHSALQPYPARLYSFVGPSVGTLSLRPRPPRSNKNFSGMCDYSSTTSRRAYARTSEPSKEGDILREIQKDKDLRDAFGKFDVVRESGGGTGTGN